MLVDGFSWELGNGVGVLRNEKNGKMESGKFVRWIRGVKIGLEKVGSGVGIWKTLE